MLENQKTRELREVVKNKMIPKTIELMEMNDIVSYPITSLSQHIVDCEFAEYYQRLNLSIRLDGCVYDESNYDDIGNNWAWYDLNKLEYIDFNRINNEIANDDVINLADNLLFIINTLEERLKKIDELIEVGKRLNFSFKKLLLIEKI